MTGWLEEELVWLFVNRPDHLVRAWDLTGARLALDDEEPALHVMLSDIIAIITFETKEQADAFFLRVVQAIKQGRTYFDVVEEGLTYLALHASPQTYAVEDAKDIKYSNTDEQE